MDEGTFRTQALELRALIADLRQITADLGTFAKELREAKADPSKPAPARVKPPAMECTDPTVWYTKTEEGHKIYRGDNLILVESPSLFMWFLDRKPLTLKQKDCAPYYHLIRQGIEFREIQL